MKFKSIFLSLAVVLLSLVPAFAQNTGTGPVTKTTTGANKNNITEDLIFGTGRTMEFKSGSTFKFDTGTLFAGDAAAFRNAIGAGTGTSAWGSISGMLSAQTDLNLALTGKPTVTGTPAAGQVAVFTGTGNNVQGASSVATRITPINGATASINTTVLGAAEIGVELGLLGDGVTKFRQLRIGDGTQAGGWPTGVLGFPNGSVAATPLVGTTPMGTSVAPTISPGVGALDLQIIRVGGGGGTLIASGAGAVAIGSSNLSSGNSSTAIGSSNSVTGGFSTALGNGNLVKGNQAVSIGSLGGSAFGNYTITIGGGSAYAPGSLAFYATGSSAYGPASTAKYNGTSARDGSIASGQIADTDSAYGQWGISNVNTTTGGGTPTAPILTVVSGSGPQTDPRYDYVVGDQVWIRNSSSLGAGTPAKVSATTATTITVVANASVGSFLLSEVTPGAQIYNCTAGPDYAESATNSQFKSGGGAQTSKWFMYGQSVGATAFVLPHQADFISTARSTRVNLSPGKTYLFTAKIVGRAEDSASSSAAYVITGCIKWPLSVATVGTVTLVGSNVTLLSVADTALASTTVVITADTVNHALLTTITPVGAGTTFTVDWNGVIEMQEIGAN